MPRQAIVDQFLACGGPQEEQHDSGKRPTQALDRLQRTGYGQSLEFKSILIELLKAGELPGQITGITLGLLLCLGGISHLAEHTRILFV